MNQVCIANLMVLLSKKQVQKNKYDLISDEDFLRHMVLNMIRSFNFRFRDDFGKLVICADDPRSWRKGFFPFYKAHRKKFREQSELDWALIFDTFQKFKDEIAEFLPYPVIQTPGAEADDIIATLVNTYSGQEPILILSGDKDFIQLQSQQDVSHYDPIHKRWLTHDDPEAYLIEHIIRGDRGDGIPNIASADDIFVVDGRQTKVTEKRLEEWIAAIKSGTFPTRDLARNYERNRVLIDLGQIPQELQEAILDKYNQQTGKDNSKTYSYFVSKGLVDLIEKVGEFR